MCSFRKSPRPEELSTLTRTASFRCVLKPMASRSALVLGRSFGGHVYVISPPSRPKMYVVPAGRKKKAEIHIKESIPSYNSVWGLSHWQHNTALWTKKPARMPMRTEHRQREVFHCAEWWLCKAPSNTFLLNGSQPRLSALISIHENGKILRKM